MSTGTTPERRIVGRSDAEVRVKRADGGAKHIIGYAAKYNLLSQPLPMPGGRRGTFREKIAPGAFDRVLKTADVRGLKNHSPHHILGRTKSGTMELASDGIGLKYDITAPETVNGRDTVTEIERGDIDGSSFAFIVDDGGDEWSDGGDMPVRTIRSIRDLFDVGPVTDPAYLDTEASTRNRRVGAGADFDAYRQRLVRYRLVFPFIRLPMTEEERWQKTEHYRKLYAPTRRISYLPGYTPKF